jgi:hypothetical protein
MFGLAHRDIQTCNIPPPLRSQRVNVGYTEVLIPVRCRHCGITSLTPFPAIVVFTALTRWKQMRLYSPCHDLAWDAAPAELQVVREHLGAEWFHSGPKELMEDERLCVSVSVNSASNPDVRLESLNAGTETCERTLAFQARLECFLAFLLELDLPSRRVASGELTSGTAP